MNTNTLSQIELATIEALEIVDLEERAQALEALEMQAFELQVESSNAANVELAAKANATTQQITKLKETAISESKKIAAFRASEVEIELQARTVNASAEKSALIEKNIKNRLRACKAFTNASEQSLDLIVKYSSASTLETLMNYQNYKTAQRVLDAAKLLCNEKHSTILDYTLKALERSMMQKTSVDSICSISNQCYARISNAVKALAFFDIIKVENASYASFNDRLIVKMSKDSLVTLNSK